MSRNRLQFKVGDRILFTTRRYSRKEGTVIGVVSEVIDRFGESDTNRYYKINPDGILCRKIWVDESDVKGLL